MKSVMAGLLAVAGTFLMLYASFLMIDMLVNVGRSAAQLGMSVV